MAIQGWLSLGPRLRDEVEEGGAVFGLDEVLAVLRDRVFGDGVAERGRVGVITEHRLERRLVQPTVAARQRRRLEHRQEQGGVDVATDGVQVLADGGGVVPLECGVEVLARARQFNDELFQRGLVAVAVGLTDLDLAPRLGHVGVDRRAGGDQPVGDGRGVGVLGEPAEFVGIHEPLVMPPVEVPEVAIVVANNAVREGVEADDVVLSAQVLGRGHDGAQRDDLEVRELRAEGLEGLLGRADLADEARPFGVGLVLLRAEHGDVRLLLPHLALQLPIGQPNVSEGEGEAPDDRVGDDPFHVTLQVPTTL